MLVTASLNERISIMPKRKYILASILSAAVIAGGTVGLVSAAAPTTKSGNIGTSGISRTTFRQEKLDAEATVLGTTTANIQTARKDKTLAQLISNAGLTKVTFRTKVKAQLTTDLLGLGYTQDQITIALQHREIVRFHHHNK